MEEEEQWGASSVLEAKSFVMNMIKNATSQPCDIGDGTDISIILPQWYDDLKFKRGQKYFSNNRCGILSSNLCGLLILLADPKGLDILNSTKQSSTAETAKKRYVSTIMHTMSWYESELYPGSRSWTSLNRVRKMYLLASNNASKKRIGMITQYELVLTTFGFMGFALVRPQLFGIRYDNKTDREGFIHFWAVLGHILGVDERFNMCLFDIETVEHICLILIRYYFLPIIQLETKKFKEMTKTLLEGLSSFMPHMSYDIQMFLVKRIVGVPGYQYKVDIANERICKNIFSADELCAAKEVIRSMYCGNEHYLRMYEILFGDGIAVVSQFNIGTVHSSVEIYDKKFHWIMGSNDTTEWIDYLNEEKFYTLSKCDQFTIRWLCFMFNCVAKSRIVRFICEWRLNFVLFLMRRFYNSL